MQIIKHYGRPMEAIDLSGDRIHREDKIFLVSHQQWFPVLEFDNHFVYHTDRLGTSLLCTCGAPGIVVSYDQYRKYASYMGEAISCMHFTMHGSHADGSH